ncbi:MAG: elongation factor P [Ilumatobacteraceae bacterium]
MPAITTNDLKNGITLNIENTLYTVVEFQHVKPGKGGAFVRTRLRNLKTGNMLDRTFNAGIRVEQAILQKSDMQFLYRDGEDYVFMDNQTYDQVNIHPVALGDAADYLVENAVAIIATHDDEIVSVEIPASVELEIANTEPGLQGDRVSGARKPATLQTGKTIQVPLFINVGDKVRVDTRSGEYITRV